MSYDPATARYLCFADARRSFASGEGAPRAYLEQCLDRIAAAEPEIKAFVCFDLDRARQAADDSDRRWRENRPLSVVDGLPVGIKDCFDVRGLPTEVNSPLFAGNTPTLDAAHVDALRRGGAIVVGKTVTTELTMGYPGPTWNPWDPTRTPGGSSSGSGAAVAAGMLPVATGSQVRGSVLRPASICGVVAMKPTYGALNHLGGFDPSPSLNHLGILAGTLTDTWEVARYLAEAAGPDPGFCTAHRQRRAAAGAKARAPRPSIYVRVAQDRRCVQGRLRRVSAGACPPRNRDRRTRRPSSQATRMRRRGRLSSFSI